MAMSSVQVLKPAYASARWRRPGANGSRAAVPHQQHRSHQAAIRRHAGNQPRLGSFSPMTPPPLSGLHSYQKATVTRQGATRVLASSSSADDLLIVGPGVLGSYAGKLWMEAHPGCTVVGQTNTDASHGRLTAMGIKPTVKPTEADAAKFDNVLFSAPPSGSADYPGEVKASLDRWNGNGSFVFTSSNSVLAPTVDADEDSALVPLGQSEKTDRLLLAEQAVLDAGGSVVRYVGLYHAQRGAHTFFLKKGEIARWGGWTVNLIHYEDAASLAVAVLSGQGNGPHKGRVFVGTDGVPVTFQDMMDSVVATGNYEGSCVFTGEEGTDKGKRVSNSRTRVDLLWEPKYPSFAAFMKETGGSDFYTTSGLF